MDKSKWQSAFAEMLPMVEQPPAPNAMALGHMMREWLANCVADAGTGVDSGGGFGCYDLWVKMDGKEMFISIKQKEAPNAASTWG